MRDLLKIDCRRIAKDNLFLVACIIGMAFALFIPIMYYVLFKASGLNEMATIILGFPINAKYVFSLSFSPGSNFAFLVPILITIALYKDFRYGTIRNKLIRGKSRASIFMSMHLTNTIFLNGILISYSLFTLGISLIFFDYQASEFGMADFLYLLQTLFFVFLVYTFIASLISFLCVLMKHSGTAILLYMAINLGFTMLASILSMGASLLSLDPTKEKLVSILEFLMKINVFYTVGTLGTGTSYSTEQTLYILIPTLLGIVVFVGLGLLVFRKKDIK